MKNLPPPNFFTSLYPQEKNTVYEQFVNFLIDLIR